MKKNKISNITKISLVAMLSIITLGIVGFLIIHTYINKMNLVNSNSTNEVTIDNNYSEIEIDEIAEEGAQDITDSPQKEIDALEEVIRQNTEENIPAIKKDSDVYNILLIGGDSRETGGSGRSDAMIIVSINSKTKRIILTSLLRDIYLKIPGHRNNRLNAAYAYGGAELLIDTIEENFGIDIDKYVSIDFYAFIDVVDSIDGVTLDVTEQDLPIINDYIKELNQHYGVDEANDLLTQSGSYVFNGKQTLGFVRNRYNGTDFKRTDRQRTVLQKIFNKIKDLNLIEIKKLSDKVLPQLTTNLTENKIISLLVSLPALKNYEIVQWSIPMDDSYSLLTIDHMSVIRIEFNKNMNELYKKVYED
ncbi:MAG: LCP family protein [Mobilitalea sp.]